MHKHRIYNITSVMSAISLNPSITPADLIEATSITSSTMNAILRYLTDNEYATGSHVKFNGRWRIAYLITEKGLSYLASAKVPDAPESEPVRDELTRALFGARICGDRGMA
jgi:DNA-binding MarR family transcriptional regulator